MWICGWKPFKKKNLSMAWLVFSFPCHVLFLFPTPLLPYCTMQCFSLYLHMLIWYHWSSFLDTVPSIFLFLNDVSLVWQLRDNISWEAISEKLATRSTPNICVKWSVRYWVIQLDIGDLTHSTLMVNLMLYMLCLCKLDSVLTQ